MNGLNVVTEKSTRPVERGGVIPVSVQDRGVRTFPTRRFRIGSGNPGDCHHSMDAAAIHFHLSLLLGVLCAH